MTRWIHHLLAGLVLCACQSSPSAQPIPAVSAGRVERLADFPSRHVDARHVDVWLPPGYSAGQRYDVLYMHDGQMLFDSSSTWNKQAWAVDVVLARLIAQGSVRPTIVVGIWNNGKFRHSEYFPQKFLASVSPDFRHRFEAEYLMNKPQADAYLRFMVEELKPAIDSRFSTRPGPDSTFVMGSSMGGAISMYAISEYPQIFGAAAGLSLAWVGMGKANTELPLAAFNYLRDHLAPPAGHRLYMDHGDQDMDVWFANYQAFIDEIVRDQGYTSVNSMSRVFGGTGHNELAWSARLDIPLLFLLRAGR